MQLRQFFFELAVYSGNYIDVLGLAFGNIVELLFKGACVSSSACDARYLVATRRLPTRRIGGRVLIPVVELRKYARGDHPEHIVT